MFARVIASTEQECYLCFIFVLITVLSVPSNLVITSWEMNELLALLCVISLIRCPVPGVLLDCIDSWSLSSSLLFLNGTKL